MATVTALVDLIAKKTEWLHEIEELMEHNSKLGNTIMQAQQTIQHNEKEIARRNQWIAFSTEIMGENVSSKSSEEEMPKPDTESEQVAFVNLPQYVMYVLDSDPDRTFFMSELKELVLKAGYKTSSPNFDNILFNTMTRLTKANRVHMIKEGHKNKYCSAKNKSESFFK